MGVAYAVKKGDMQLSDVDVDYRDKVKDLVDGMTLKKLKDFAETKHEGLPEVVENISIGNVGGMGPVKLPTSTENGSGDVPAGQGDAEEEYEKKKRKMKHLKNFESFLNEGLNESTTFQELVDKYKDNPYGIGADSIEYEESENWGNQLVLRFTDSYGRKETEARLKKMGIKAKKMSKSTADKAFKYRYELTVFESKVNEEYIEMPSFDDPTTDLIEEFKIWYKITANNWEDYSQYMSEDSIDEAAKNAQMEILAHLSNEMNNVIKDRKFKVRMDLK
jgi:hypothetical protein